MSPKKDEYMRGYADGFKDGKSANPCRPEPPNRHMLARILNWMTDNIRESDDEGAVTLAYLSHHMRGYGEGQRDADVRLREVLEAIDSEILLPGHLKELVDAALAKATQS